MDTYLNLKTKNGTTSQNILETPSKLKKPINKVELPIKLIDESDDDSETSSDASDESDNDATPVEPIKKGKILPKFIANTSSSSTKKKIIKPDSDDSDDSDDK